MKPEIAHRYLLPACNTLFGPSLATPEAQVLLIAIGLQESGFLHRQQLTGGVREWWKSLTGPAAGYWQCERIGVRGVMQHRKAGPMLEAVCEMLGYPFDLETIWSAIRYDNILAVAVARLILYTHPDPLPGLAAVDAGWQYYLGTWRPGKPKPDAWARHWVTATIIVRGVRA